MADVPNTAINDELTIDPRLRAYGDWRGPLAPARDSAEQALAGKVVTVAMQIARELTKQPDVQDRHWMTNGQLRQALLGKTEEDQATTAIHLAKACMTRLQWEPSMVRVGMPTKIFGDLHGQLRDLVCCLLLPSINCEISMQVAGKDLMQDIRFCWSDSAMPGCNITLCLRSCSLA
eukprot:6168759-Pleurochrysis_carterae.AAC.1